MADDPSTSPSWYDPAQTLTQDDPLRDWANQHIDWATGKLLQQDPSGQKAIDALISRGVPPPPVHAPSASSTLGYADAFGNNQDATTGMPTTDMGAPIRQNPNGTIAGNITSPTDPDVTPQVPPPAPRNAITSAAEPTPLPAAPPTPEVPPPTPPKPNEAPKKKPDDNPWGDFGKSLQGIKVVQPPAVNPVGTPSVRSPGASGATNIAQLLSLIQGGTPATAPSRLAQMLAQGKIS